MIFNYNNAIQTNFKITLPNVPVLEFFAMSVNIPTVSIGAIEASYQDARAKIPDNKFVWDDITIQFILDEDLYSYEILTQWMKDSRKDNPHWLKALNDVVILPLDSNKTIEYSFLLQQAFPTVISGWQYTSNSSVSEIITFDVTFAYQHFEIKREKPINFRIVTVTA